MAIILFDENKVPQNKLEPIPKLPVGRRVERATTGKIPKYGALKRGIKETIAERELPSDYEKWATSRIKSPRYQEYQKSPWSAPYRWAGALTGEVLDFQKEIAPLTPNIIAKAIPGVSGLSDAIGLVKKVKGMWEGFTDEEKSKAKVEALKQMPGTMATEIATSVRHPFRSLARKPISTVSDWVSMLYVVGKGAKATKALYRKIRPQKDMFSLMKKAQGQIKALQNRHGELLGKEKEIVKGMKGSMDTTKMVESTLKEMQKTGFDVLDDIDIGNINKTMAKLGYKGVINSADDLERALIKVKPTSATPKNVLEARDMINNKFVTHGQPGVGLSSKSTPRGEGILNKVRDEAVDEIGRYDMGHKGTGGRWQRLNQEYADVANLKRELSSVIGKDKTLSNAGSRVGKKLLEKEPYYTKLFERLDSATGGGGISNEIRNAAEWEGLMKDWSGAAKIVKPLISTPKYIARKLVKPFAFGANMPREAGLAVIPRLLQEKTMREEYEKRLK